MTARNNLKHHRASLRFSQAQLAALAGVSKTTVVDAEEGKPISLVSAYAILEALNLLRARAGKPEITLDDVDWNVRE